MSKLLEKYNWQSYSGIENDVYKLVDGNPFYLNQLFSPHSFYKSIKKKDKNFSSKKELHEVFLFEATHNKGGIFNFWKSHYEQNAKYLDKDTPEQAGLTLKILQYLATKQDVISVRQIADHFKLEEEVARAKMRGLIEGDFVEEVVGQSVTPLKDPVMGLALTQVYYYELKRDGTAIFPDVLDRQ